MKINQSLSEYLHNTDKLRNLIRYQTAARVASESVAEHSFFVSAYVLKLNDYYNFDLLKALQIALLHDFSEVFISDVPHPIKKAYPEIATVLESVERDMNTKYISSDYADSLEEFNHLTSPEGIIVALADILSVVTYSKYEISLGNSKYMAKVLEATFQRYTTVLEDAEPFLKDGHTTPEILGEIFKFIQ